MTAPGKSLKDLYDAGSNSLLQLEKDVSGRLKEKADSQTESGKSNENDLTGKLENRGSDLENELRTFMASSIERLQKVMADEIKDTDDHLETVKFDLTKLADKLKNTIVELRRSYEENVDNLRLGLSDRYEGNVEAATTEMERQDFTSSKHVRAHGTFVMNSLQQRLDHSLWESRGEEKQYNSALFKAFMQKANSIDTHFSTLMQKLSTDFQGHFKVVEHQSTQADPQLGKAAQDLTADIDEHAKLIENDVNQVYKKVVEEHSKKLDNNLSTVAQDLSSVHDATTERLSEQTKQLSAGLVTASGEARDALSTKCTDLREKVDEMLQSFTTRLEDKLQNTHNLRETLELEKQSIFEEIHKELTDIREGFEKRLAQLMKEGLERVTAVTDDAENEISDKFQRADQEIRREGLAAKTEIEQAISEFVTLLSEQRKNALEQIAKAAGAAGAASSGATASGASAAGTSATTSGAGALGSITGLPSQAFDDDDDDPFK
jgi:hypothetical protein